MAVETAATPAGSTAEYSASLEWTVRASRFVPVTVWKTRSPYKFPELSAIGLSFVVTNVDGEILMFTGTEDFDFEGAGGGPVPSLGRSLRR